MTSSTKQEAGRFAIIPARAVDDRRLNRHALLVLLALGTYSDPDGWCWPSIATLARRTSLDPRHVKRGLRLLYDTGYLETDRQHDDRGTELAARRRVLYDGILPGRRRSRQGGAKSAPGGVGQKSTKQGGAKSATQNVPLRERSSSNEEGCATRKQIFSLGLSLLCPTEPGIDIDLRKREEKNARSLLGRLVSRTGDDRKALAVLKAAENSIEPKAYIAAAAAKAENERRAGGGRRAPSPALGTPEHMALLQELGL